MLSQDGTIVMTLSSFTPLVVATSSAFLLLALPLCAVRSLACDGVDCGVGYCIQRETGSYECVCLGGYEGDNCDKLVFRPRFTRGTDNTCDAMPCQNGGTCIPIVDGMSGEAPMDMGESMPDCSVEGSCYTCMCAPGFTGPQCSVTTRKCWHVNR